MGIGRREFLKLFGVGIATLSAGGATPTNSIAIFEDQYVNRKLGIAFCKPKKWTFADIKQMGDVKAGQILDLDDSDLVRELVETAELPILSISRDPLSADAQRFTPGVTINLDRFELLDALSTDVEVEMPIIENMDGDIETCQSMLKDFRATSRPQSVRVSECDSAEYTAEFLFEHENMTPTRVRMRTLSIFHNPALYTVRMFDSRYGEDMTFDYAPFVQSIKML